MNQATSQKVERSSKGLQKGKGFWNQDKKVINNQKIILASIIYLWGIKGVCVTDYLFGVGQKILDLLVKTTFLGEGEALVRWGIKPPFGSLTKHKWLHLGPAIIFLKV